MVSHVILHCMSHPVSEEIIINRIEEGEQVTEENGELPVDVYRTDDTITIIGVVACKREDLSIRINENVLVISGRRYPPPLSGGEFMVRECFWGNFTRMIVLPAKVDVSHAHAALKNGVLALTIPVIFEVKERIIPINEE